MIGYKVLNRNFIQKGFQYKVGLNIDTKRFIDGECCSNGLHFTSREKLHKYLEYGELVAEVEIPIDARVYHDTDKSKADKLIIRRVISKWDLTENFFKSVDIKEEEENEAEEGVKKMKLEKQGEDSDFSESEGEPEPGAPVDVLALMKENPWEITSEFFGITLLLILEHYNEKQVKRYIRVTYPELLGRIEKMKKEGVNKYDILRNVTRDFIDIYATIDSHFCISLYGSIRDDPYVGKRFFGFFTYFGLEIEFHEIKHEMTLTIAPNLIDYIKLDKICIFGAKSYMPYIKDKKKVEEIISYFKEKWKWKGRMSVEDLLFPDISPECQTEEMQRNAVDSYSDNIVYIYKPSVSMYKRIFERKWGDRNMLMAFWKRTDNFDLKNFCEAILTGNVPRNDKERLIRYILREKNVPKEILEYLDAVYQEFKMPKIDGTLKMCV